MCFNEERVYKSLPLSKGFVCLAIPGKIVEIDENKSHAIVDYGEGTRRKANISLVEAREGDYVLVHAGFAIETIDEKEARETLKVFKQMLEKNASEG